MTDTAHSPSWGSVFKSAGLCGLVSFAMACVYYWPWMRHLDVPFEAGGDAFQKLFWVATSVRKGWLFFNDSVGWPQGSFAYDFPRFDSLNYLLMKLIALVARDPIVVANLYLLLGYGAIGFTSAVVLRASSVSSSWSIVGGITFAWLPFHQWRGEAHLTNAAYFFVPLLVWFAVSLIRPVRNPVSARHYVATALLATLTELQNPYYAVFAGVMISGVLCVLALVHKTRLPKHVLMRAAVMLAALAMTFLVEQSPRLLFQREHGSNPAVATRGVDDSNRYSLQAADLLRPDPALLSRLFEGVAPSNCSDRAWVHCFNERTGSSLPPLGLFGLLVLLFYVVRRLLAKTEDGESSLTLALAVCCCCLLVWAHSGALSSLLAEGGITSVRAWNRSSVFVAFACVWAAVDWLSRSVSLRRRSVEVVTVALLGTLPFGLAMASGTRPNFAVVAAKWQSVVEVTAELSKHRAKNIFIAPYVPYPENGPLLGISDYDHFALWLADPALRLSYGAVRGRGSHYAHSAVSSLPPEAWGEFLSDGGFDTLLLDCEGFTADQLRGLVSALTAHLGEPFLTGQRWVAYDLPDSAVPARGRTYQLGSWVDMTDPRARRYLELGWSHFEAAGTWTDGQDVSWRFAVGKETGSSLTLRIRGSLFEPLLNKQRIRLSIDGEHVCELQESTREHGEWKCPISLQPSDELHEVKGRVVFPASPQDKALSTDTRRLGLLMTAWRID